MGVVGMLFVALIIGFLVMTNMSSLKESDSASELPKDHPEHLQIDAKQPANTLESVESRVDNLLQSSEDKYRDFDK
jgi:hypothetical protein